ALKPTYLSGANFDPTGFLVLRESGRLRRGATSPSVLEVDGPRTGRIMQTKSSGNTSRTAPILAFRGIGQHNRELGIIPIIPSSGLAEELGVPGECGGGPAGGGAVHDPGGGEAASPGAVGLPAGRAVTAERGGDGVGVAAAGPVGGEPSGA